MDTIHSPAWSRIATLTFASLLLFSLVSCGGGGGADTGPTGFDISGTVADGYLSGATVCLDINTNKICDNSEPSGITDQGGRYTLNLRNFNDLYRYPVLVEVTTATVDQDSGLAVSKPYKLTAPPGRQDFISPLTTLVQGLSERNPSLSTDDASQLLMDAIGFVPDVNVSLFDDYVQSNGPHAERLHKIAQVIAAALGQEFANISYTLEPRNQMGTSIDAASSMKSIYGLVTSDIYDRLETAVTAIDSATSSIDVASIADSVIASHSSADIATEILLREAVSTKSQTIDLDAQHAEGLVSFFPTLSSSEVQANRNPLMGYKVEKKTFGSEKVLSTSYYLDNSQSQFVPSSLLPQYLRMSPDGWVLGPVEGHYDAASRTYINYIVDAFDGKPHEVSRYTLSGNATDLGGLRIVDVLKFSDLLFKGSSYAQTWINQVTNRNANATFSASGKSRLVNLNGVLLARRYVLSCGEACFGSTGINHVRLLNGMIATQFDDLVQPTPGNSTSLTSLQASSHGQVVGATSAPNGHVLAFLMELVGQGNNGTVYLYQYDYTENTMTLLSSSEPWERKTVNHEEVLEINLPDDPAFRSRTQITSGDKLIYSVYHGVLYSGASIPPGTRSTEPVLTYSAFEDVLTAIGR
ncbi:MAG: hypothetical protein GC138_01805 [Gammaproteobacteria bacterium]|nr:hypothetical protein [Gammaproteobacteria bacterium]